MTNEIFEKYGPNPLTLYKEWLSEAGAREINDPDAACLATSDKNGKPSARMILIKDISDKGLKFHTNEQSDKGQDLAENPHAALCIHWKSTRKQIRIEGKVEMINDAEADEYFAERPRARQIGAWASQQSRPFEHELDLSDALAKYDAEFEGKDIPRPPYWKGYRLIPTCFEFWIGQKDRVHTRFVYRLENGEWDASWLYP